jgi:hypothetical protein
MDIMLDTSGRELPTVDKMLYSQSVAFVTMVVPSDNANSPIRDCAPPSFHARTYA